MEGLYHLFWIDCGDDTRCNPLVLLSYSIDIWDCERGDDWLHWRACRIDLEEMMDQGNIPRLDDEVFLIDCDE